MHSIRKTALPRDHCQMLFKSRKTAGILMAVPFVVCFALFGIFNLIGGTILTTMACKPKYTKPSIVIIQRLLQQHTEKMKEFLDPMKVIGIILLTTGSLLVMIGILLGVVACKSINFDYSRCSNSTRRKTSWVSLSGAQPCSSTNGPLGNFTSVISFGKSSSRKSKSKQSSDCLNPMDKSSVTSSRKTTVHIDVHKAEEDMIVSTNGEVINCGNKFKDIDLNKVLSESDNSTQHSHHRTPSKKSCNVSWAATVLPECAENRETTEQKIIKPP